MNNLSAAHAGRRYKSSALKLIDAAERLFGDHGIDSISLQQIAGEAGQANKYAVQYHFGSRAGLVDAIFEVRLPIINARRQALLDALKASGNLDIRSLLGALFIPVIEHVDAEDKHRYARFSGRVRSDPLYRRGWFNSSQLAAVAEVFDLLRTACPHLSPWIFDMRIIFCLEIFDSAVRIIDNPDSMFGRAYSGQRLNDEDVIGQALSTCADVLGSVS